MARSAAIDRELDTKLKTDDHVTVYERLFDACTHWYNIGLKLNAPNEKLKKIREANRDDSERCLCEMIDYSIKSDDGLTWRKVCNSLRSPLVKCDQIAEDIEVWLINNPQQKVGRDTDLRLNLESHVTDEEFQLFNPSSESENSTYEAGLTVEVLQTRMKITDKQLNLKLLESDLYELAACFDNTDDYVEKLGLSDAEQTDVKEEKAKRVMNRTQAGMKLALKYWLKTENLKATFRSLLSLILSMDKGNVAVKVCEFLRNKQQPPNRKRRNSMQSGTSKQRRLKKSDSQLDTDTSEQLQASEELDLLEQDLSMEDSFNFLSNQTRDSLEGQGYKPPQLLSCLQGYDMFPELLEKYDRSTIILEEKEKCMKCETINEMWPYIGNFFTSYSYKILKALIKQLGTETDKKCLQDYEKLFIEHSKKSLENYGGALARFTEGTTYTELILKINRSYKKIAFKHLEELKINLAKAIEIPNDHLKLFRLRPGCIEITYHVPLYVEFQLKAFSISTEQRTLLEHLRVIWLKCGSFWYYVQNVDGSGPGNNQRRPDTDGDRSSDARKKFISNINPDIFVDTTDSISVFEQLEKASSVHDSESGYGTMGKDFTFDKVPSRKQPEEKTDRLGRLDNIETSQMKTFPDAMKAQIDTSRLLKRYKPKRNENNTQLHIACYNGDVLKVSACIQVQKLDPLDFNQHGDTALHTAARAGHLNVVKYLVEQCQVNAACEADDDSTAFHVAAFYGHKHIVKYFIEQSVDPLYCNEYEETPLFLACLAGDVQIVQLLVKEAQKHQLVEDFICNTTLTGETVLHYAVLSKKLEVVKYLVTILQTEAATLRRLALDVPSNTAQHRFALLDEADRNWRMPIHLACQCGSTDIVQYLVESKTYKPDLCTNNGCTPLHYAALSEKPCVLEYLIKEHNCDVTCTDILNNTPVHYAAIGGTLETFKCLIEAHGCDPSVLNNQKESPLHMACEHGQILITKYLIEDQKCNQCCKASRGNTPLHYAAFGGHYETVKYLTIDRECDPNTKNDDNNETPLFFASYGEHNIALMLGDDVFHHIKNPPRFMKTIKFLVEEYNCRPTLSHPGKSSPLQIACFYDNIMAVQYYIEDQKCDKDSKDTNGMVLIHIAALGDAIDVFTYLVETQQVDKNSSDNNGNTPLHYAADTRGKESLKKDLVKSVLKTPTKLPFHQKTGLKNIITDMNQKGIEYHQLNLSVLRYLMSGVTSISELTNSNGQTPLHIACKRGELSTVKLLSDFELETKDNEGATPLHYAAKCGHLPVVEYLALEKKCDIRCVDNDNDTPAHLAAISGHLDVMKFFVEKMGFVILSEGAQESHDIFPIHLACVAGNIDVVRYLVEEFRCDVMQRDEDGDVPLHYTAMVGDITTIKYLVEECGCDVLVANENGLTPLHYSINNNIIDIVKYFVEECECNVQVKTKDGQTPLHLAARFGNTDVAKYLLSKNSDLLLSRDNDGCTPLHTAATHGEVEMCKLLISDFYCDKNDIAETGQTPLHFAASNGHLPVVEYLTLEVNCDKSSTNVDGFTPAHLAVINEHLDVLKFFVERLTYDIRNEKALANIMPIHSAAATNDNTAILKYLVEECKSDVMVKDSCDRVPLHYAAILGQVETVRYLIEECECEAIVKDSEGMLPLDYSTANKTTEVMRYLIEECQCPLNSMNKMGQVLLHHAATCGNIEAIVYLTSKTTDRLPRDFLELTPLHCAVLIGSLPIVTYYISYLKCDPNIPYLSDTTLIQVACFGDHLDIVQFFKQCPESDFQASDRDGKTCLHYALGAKQIEVSHFLVDRKLCDVTARDKAGNTCLHVAAEHGLLELVQSFVDNFGCDPNSLNASGLTPFHLACENGHEEVIEYLTRHIRPVTKGDNFTDLYFALRNNNIEIAKELALSPEYDLKSRDQDGKTILHYCVKTLRREFIEFLIFERGCDVTIADNEGNTCLHIAAELGQLELVQMFVMVYGLKINHQNSVGLTPLHLAVCKGYEDVARFLLEQPNCDAMRKNKDDHTPLHLAIMVESLEIVQMFLMDERTKVNIKDDKGNSLLHTLASQFSPDSDLSVMRLLLAFGANPTAVNIFNETPLHVACIHGHEEIADVIISHMDPCSITTEMDCSKATPLHHAALGGNLNIVKLLMSNGYNPMRKDCQGNTALHYAAINGQIDILRHLIVDSDLDPNCMNENGFTPAHAACSGASLIIARHLFWSGAATETDLYNTVCFLGSEIITLNQNLKTNTGENILHSASRSGYKSIVGYLIIVLKFDPHITNHVGCTPLDIAIGYRNSDVIPFLRELTPTIQFSPSALHLAALLGHISSVQYYITDLQSDPDLQDSIGRTPLHYAAMGGRQAISRFLIHSKADLLFEDVFHNLPLHYAAALGHFDLVQFLVNIGSRTTTRGVLGKTLAEMAMDGGHTRVVDFLSSLPDSRKTPQDSLIDSLD